MEFGRKSSEAQKGKQAGEANPMFGKSIFDFMTPEEIETWRRRHAEACTKRRGKPSPIKGKHHSDKAKEKISQFMKGFHWWNNGEVAVRDFECPGPGFKPGRLKLSSEWKKRIADGVNARKHEWRDKLIQAVRDTNVRRKVSEAAKKRNAGRRWWNDGSVEVFQVEQPDGFEPGRIS